MKILEIILTCSLLVSCSDSKSEYKKLQGQAFGTTYSVVYSDIGQRDYKSSIDSIVDKMNQSLSTYQSDSDISRINSGDSLVLVDEKFAEVFEKSDRIYKETNGYFDPTVGLLVNAWGFGPGQRVEMDSIKIDSLMQFVGFDKVALSDTKVSKKYSQMYFDFNAIAKGYGIDLIARFLESKNVANYLVEVGGEIRCKGNNTEGELWKAGVESPNTDGSRSLIDVVVLNNESMATSGNYRKFKKDSLGNKYVHTINPKTGWATPSNLLSVSVVGATDCADVDAYATAFMAMGKSKTQEFLVSNKALRVVLIFVNESGELEVSKVNF